MRTITVKFADGSGWRFTRKEAGGFWNMYDLHLGEPEEKGGIVADTIDATHYISTALHYAKSVTITAQED